MKRRALVGAVVAALVVAAPAYAHYFMSSDSVDGGEIRYEKETEYTYTTDFAIGKWNDVGRINIAGDAWYTATDLTFKDYTNCDSDYAGWWHPHSGSDHVHYNKCYMNGYAYYDRRALAVHELGHALRLNHNPYRSQIMYTCPACTDYSTPQSHDRQDYHERWGQEER